jgi:hypothetical protein
MSAAMSSVRTQSISSSTISLASHAVHAVHCVSVARRLADIVTSSDGRAASEGRLIGIIGASSGGTQQLPGLGQDPRQLLGGALLFAL